MPNPNRPTEFPTSPWGSHRPGPGQRFFLGVTRALVAVPVLKQLGLIVRWGVRHTFDFVDVELWGLRLRLAAHGNFSEVRLGFVPHSWDREEREILAEHLAPGAVFVDVGGNAGGYVWWVLSLLGRDCTVITIEPDPLLVAALRFNLAQNDAHNVVVEPVAVGAAVGTGTLRIDPENRGENRLVVGGEGGASATASIPVRPLADVLRSHGVARVDGLKIDVEGHEMEVLEAFFRDAPREIWPRLLITEYKETPVHDRLRALLLDAGYRVERRTKLNLVCRLG